MEVNPNHPVTKSLHDHWHKLVGVIMHKLGIKEVRIVPEDMQFLAETPMAVVAHEKPDGLYITLTTLEEGKKLAQSELVRENPEKKIARHEIFYFGCRRESGHHINDPSGRLHRRVPVQEFPFSERNLDAGILLPWPERLGTGSLQIIRGWTFLSWWGNNPFDKRPGVNQSIIAKGEWTADEIWIAFQVFFPDLAELPRPTLV